jgi:hypothetical protein
MSFKEFLESELNEATVSIQVTDVKDTIANIKKHNAGFVAKPSKTQDDEIVVDLKDKEKVVKWMTGDWGGWELDDIKELYPELLK